jgi:hypothetical protein
MTIVKLRYALLPGLVAAGMLWNGNIDMNSNEGFVSTAEARIGRPLTPVSYAGVARRSTVCVPGPGIACPGLGGVGGPASGVGVLPGMGAGQAGIGYSGGVGMNLGGPVNRVGVR